MWARNSLRGGRKPSTMQRLFFFFLPRLFNREKVQRYRAVLLGSLQAQTVFILAKDCSIKHRLRYFETVVSSTARFAAEHRQLYRKHLEKYDIQFRKFVRRIVGPPPGTNCSAQWHEWNMHVDYWVHASGISSLSNRCMTQYWNFASYISNAG